MNDPSSFFQFNDEDFVATGLCRGPWHPDFAHAGPPSALLGREVERQAATLDTPVHVARVHIDIPRPIPLGGMCLNSRVENAGRQVTRISATLTSSDGKICCQAHALCIRKKELQLPAVRTPTVSELTHPNEGSRFEFPFFQSKTGYHKAMAIRFIKGRIGDGEVIAWMRMRYPLLPTESPTPLQRVLIAADSGNGLSMALNPKQYTFVNPDLDVVLHRLPRGQWIGLEARTDLNLQGLGLADTRLWDETGPIGRSTQTLLVDGQNGVNQDSS